MALSGKEFQEIQEALLDGYRDLFDLRQMVRFGLDESLDSIAGGWNVVEQVFNLIDWADRKGRVLDLVRSAYEYNQGNEALKRLHDALITPPEQESEGKPSIVPSPTAQVFLSYSSQDIDSMRLAAQVMREQDISVWTAEGLEPGSPDWQVAIESALRNTECMVVLLSPDAKQSRWVGIEIAVTQRLGRRVFPVLIRGTHDNAVPISLETVQYIDARQAYQSNIESRLVPSVARYLGVAASAVRGQQVRQELSQLPSSPIDIDWVTIPAGEFTVSKDAKGEDAGKTVTLPEYRIAKRLVTKAQYKAFMDATGHRMPDSGWDEETYPEDEGEEPVVGVSWEDATACCRWASEVMGMEVRFPTEAEWEKARLELEETDLWEWMRTLHSGDEDIYVVRHAQSFVFRDFSRYGDRRGGFRLLVVPAVLHTEEGKSVAMEAAITLIDEQQETEQQPSQSELPIDFDWVTIPAGEFTVSKEAGGADAGKTVMLPEYRIAKRLVTKAQYKAFLNATGNEKPRYGWGNETHPEGEGEEPVVGVTWEDVIASCQWASEAMDMEIRLPTEAEWEKARPELEEKKLWEWTSTRHARDFRNYVMRERSSAASRWHIIRAGSWDLGFRWVVVPISS